MMEYIGTTQIYLLCRYTYKNKSNVPAQCAWNFEYHIGIPIKFFISEFTNRFYSQELDETC